MGRTNPTFRDRIRNFEEEWQAFRRALREPQQEHFDELIEKADRFAAAAGHQNPVHAHQAITIAIFLAQEIEPEELRERVRELEAALEDAL